MKILLVDKSADVRELTAMMLSSQFVTDIVQAEDGAEAVRILESQGQFDIVISGYKMSTKNGHDIFKSLRQISSRVPFMLVSSQAYSHLSEFNHDLYFEALQKPFEEELLIGKVQLLVNHAETKDWKSGYIPVAIEILEKMNSVSVPLFIQLSENHFVKLSHAKNLFTAVDAQKMRSRGISSLFVELGDYSIFIGQFRKNVFSQVAWDQADPKDCLEILSRDWDLVMKASRKFGFTEKVINLAQENISRGLAVMSQTVNFKSAFKDFSDSKQSRLSAHCYMLAILCTAIAKELGWVASATLQKLTYAALLHDVDLDEELFTSKQTLINSTDFRQFTDDPGMMRLVWHPKKASELIAAWSSCPSDVEELIIQHHEKIDGTGFPMGIDYKTIAPLSAIFILAEDIIYHSVDNFGISPLEFLKSRFDYYQHGEFIKIYAAVERVLSAK